MVRRRRFPRRRFNRVMHFKRSYTELITVPGGGLPLNHAFVFKLSNVPNSADFTNLFDAYRINKAVVKILPPITSSVLYEQTSGIQTVPVVTTTLDYNDDNTGFSESELLEYSTVKVHRGFGPIVRKLTPACELGILGSGTALVSGVQKFKQWIDVAALDCKHFGVKAAFTPFPGTMPQYNYRCFVTLYMSMKQFK